MYGDEEEVLDTELLYIFKNWEMFLQLLDTSNPSDVASNYRGAETVIFTRRWRPSTFTLEPFVDTPLSQFNRIELGRILGEASGLSPDKIEIAKAPGTFPCEGSLLGIHDEITWVPLLTTDGDIDDGAFKYPCNVQTDGDVVYWREKGEPLKKLTEQERREILGRENADSAATGTSYSTVSTSPRKERPLRIFIDSPKSSVKETIEPDLD